MFDTETVIALRYRDEVFEPIVCLYRGAVGLDFPFMDEGTSPHSGALVFAFLQREDIQSMQWPAYFSDLNPVKLVWDILGKHLAVLSHPSSSVPDSARLGFLKARTQLIHRKYGKTLCTRHGCLRFPHTSSSIALF
ncbi:hypothetical protein AVEN_37275-1 [Araneus ventricosus]|uniref:Tc1-like transposase DDE domain-containing protein n=1 Tax=Araneus ventricosus TaxID=182803 RepID=A0A4Y2UDT0_ARAVE|nr:hypothetical protein AVEN_176809-1 [Araneus ventricosus]GBO09421.1 hypothetical protein AVEN_129208-1 [Araneus ventricosus]GBO09776.1 hypothetical protein AVEN_260153-1 [Araneus ventricosus]GBO09777.1 hypothetical protein AVEN_37275-1 [Araneus ventricosus]